jgi:hypothetical protein
MAKVQFRTRDLLCAVSLIGLSLGAFTAWIRFAERGPLAVNRDVAIAIQIPVCTSCASCLGAGIGCLFRRPFIGAVWGAIAGFVSVFGATMYYALLELERFPRQN